MAETIALSRRSLFLFPLALAACKRGTSVLELTGNTMGTTYNVVAVDHTGTLARDEVGGALETVLAEVNAQMSNWDAGSEISRFNAGAGTAPVTVSPELAEVMRAAEDVNRASDGQFDVTLGPLIELWGFGAGGAGLNTPDDDAIAAALQASGQGRTLRIGADTLQKTAPGAGIYLSAIGKGHGVDRIARAIESFGIRDYMVEIGGDLFTAGLNPDGQPWRIGIETPDAADRGIQSVVGVSGLGMATSGDYRNYFERDGQRFSHILDAQTGRPITHTTASATVLTDNAMLADAWATAMLTLGKARGLEIAEARNLAVLFIERDSTAADLRFTATPSSRFAALQA